MAPLKFEEKIKEKLEQRVIKPSDNSWEQLATQLDEAQNQKKGSKKVWWYAIAAIFVGVLVVNSIVINQDPSSELKDIQFVDNSKEVIKDEDIQIVLDDNTLEKPIEDINSKILRDNQKKTNKNSIEREDRKVSNHMITSKNIVPKDSMFKEIYDDKQYSAVKLVENNKEAIEMEEEVLSIDSLIIEDKVAGVIAQIKELQKNNTKVTDDEIDQLLLKAQREITRKEVFESSNRVSASALLQDIENELDETFKQRVFEALKTGFQKVKTAVVERDN